MGFVCSLYQALQHRQTPTSLDKPKNPPRKFTRDKHIFDRNHAETGGRRNAPRVPTDNAGQQQTTQKAMGLQPIQYSPKKGRASARRDRQPTARNVHASPFKTKKATDGRGAASHSRARQPDFTRKNEL